MFAVRVNAANNLGLGTTNLAGFMSGIMNKITNKTTNRAHSPRT